MYLGGEAQVNNNGTPPSQNGNVVLGHGDLRGCGCELQRGRVDLSQRNLFKDMMRENMASAAEDAPPVLSQQWGQCWFGTSYVLTGV